MRLKPGVIDGARCTASGFGTNEMESVSRTTLKVDLTFAAFRTANVSRCLKWHPQGIESWSPSDWMTAVVGELGELASLLKMRNRERDGLPGNKFAPTDQQIADEIADVFTYLDLLAASMGIDLARAAVEKFNRVSERAGFPDRIVSSDPLDAPRTKERTMTDYSDVPAKTDDPAIAQTIVASAKATKISDLQDTEADNVGLARFASAMKAKLSRKRLEGRRGWNDPTECTVDWLWRLLCEHVDKGDPVDIANLAMMIWNRQHPYVDGPAETSDPPIAQTIVARKVPE